MVRFNPVEARCHLYEIKHSNQRHPGQCRHLLDEEKLDFMKRIYGDIASRNILYLGEAEAVGSIVYQNVENYLLEQEK